MKFEDMKYFKHFLDCFFYQDYGYNDLPMIMAEFKKTQPIGECEGLLKDVMILNNQGDWDSLQKFIRMYGMRGMSCTEIKSMLDMMIAILESRDYDTSLFENLDKE